MLLSALAGFGLACSVSGQEQEAAESFGALKLKYSIDREKIEKSGERLLEDYLGKLQALRRKFANAEDLVKLDAVQSAIDAGDPRAGASPPSVAEIADVWKAYVAQRRALPRRQLVKSAEIMRDYGRKLTTLKSDLTKAGELGEATEVATELSRITVELRRVDSLLAINNDMKLEGRFHVSVDDSASVYVNGKLVHKARLNQSASKVVPLKIGDAVVVSLRNRIAGKRFQLAFRTSDGRYVLSFRARDFRIMDRDSKKRALTPLEFGTLKTPAVVYGNAGNRFPFKHGSEWIWGHGNRAVLGAIVTTGMIRPGSGAAK